MDEIKIVFETTWGENIEYVLEYELNVEYERSGKNYLISDFQMKIVDVNVGLNAFWRYIFYRKAYPFEKFFEFNFDDLKKLKGKQGEEFKYNFFRRLFKYAFEDYENKKKVYMGGEYEFSIK